MTRIGVHLIFGQNVEPFLEAALRSVAWADYVCAVNTAPGHPEATRNEETIRRIVPGDRLRHDWYAVHAFSFADARNMALALADDGDYVLIVDADDIHWPAWERICREHVERGTDILTAHFEHLCLYKDLRHSLRHREILLRKDARVGFSSGVHEILIHPRECPALAHDYRYHHFGYVKPPAQIYARWMFYKDLGGGMHEYDGTPDDALEDWPRVCEPYDGEHPPAVRELLDRYPPAPGRVHDPESRAPVVGLVLLTWDDAANLKGCLESLARTNEPFALVVVDNGSTDDSVALVDEAFPSATVLTAPGRSLAQALNIGFASFLSRGDVDYVGWIHPDMIFDHPGWLGELRHMLDVHPDVAKVGAEELDPSPGVRSGNSQCYLVRRWALEQAGLFDERFIACGGYEDWEHNARLLKTGRILIWPPARITHAAMGTRRHHDNNRAALDNSQLYCELTGRSDPPV